MSGGAPRLGLVLSGGGAKGAYQVGVIEYLAQIGARPHMISGASIGSLNGAIVATSKDLEEAAHRLRALWNRVAEQSPLEVNWRGIGLMVLVEALNAYVGNFAPSVARIALRLGLSQREVAMFRDEPLRQIVGAAVTPEALGSGLPFWVSVYESLGFNADLAELLTAVAGLDDTRPSRFLSMQSLPPAERLPALFASAAIPLAFTAKELEGRHYVDGGLGGWNTVQGNTPIAPLVQAGCSHVIVTHLSDGSLWNRYNHPGVVVLEVRPRTIARDGGLKDVLGFEQRNIDSWIEQGFEDARHSIGEMRQALAAVDRADEAREQAQRAVGDANTAVEALRGRDFKLE